MAAPLVANIATAFVGLFALGIVEFRLGTLEATVFATTQVGITGQQLASAVSALFVEPSQVSGIVALGGSQFGSTVAGALTFSVLVHMNLAVLNLLPLPPLDGGRILFCLLETLYRPLVRLQAPAAVVGWVLVMGLMVYATIQDIDKLAAGVFA